MRINERGLTLVELLVAMAIFALIAVGATSLLSASLDNHAYGNARYDLYQEGLMVMERMTGEVRRCTFLLIPNNHTPARDILAISGLINEDNDYYFDDTLFPRIDEDPKNDNTDDGAPGISLIDDDGDGEIDESGDNGNDDEDALFNEDPLDGEDNDTDGNFDEDLPNDVNNDGASGFLAMDDDGDNLVDEASQFNDDEDNATDEDSQNPVLYIFDSGTNTLKKSVPHLSQTVNLSTRVSAFQVNYETPDRILITLTLTGKDGEIVTFSENVYLENTYQRIGKRVW